MNGKKARRIRREVYGDMSHRAAEYVTIRGNDKTMVAAGLRRRYRDAKQERRNR